ncbi:PfkB family carbohydrate kinase [Candidatus Sulfidibacterium hydrothermale]|uniref:bifunctional heptose 7-phosphate kinase/heptose 1-phosphate adenyltransferase n=1 Tax=Candidatus Sulfidibacterium hydrothermale TaxID=2875962 RepID=UPI001F0ACFE3|nr:PfkB family carbohydrate kinase [Candidatus Sulfidibacterium hydrothermale]UBM61490.1 PfkB family carbohydrate kinase [Candidatus Sulfidibacterium hydrothermale]
MKLTKEILSVLFEDFNNKKALIIGDVMLDAYIWGKVDRISPEAPVPVVTVLKREERLGGAANVGMNIRALGAKAIMCSVVGTDEKGRVLKALMHNNGLDESGIIESPHRPTTTKFRILGNNTQMLRVDEETSQPLEEEIFHELCSRIDRILKTENVDVIIFQDYDKGVITPDLIRFVTEIATELGIPVTVDPKKRNFLSYQNTTLVKPNLAEMKEGLEWPDLSAEKTMLELAAKKLAEKLQASMIMNTLSEKGVFIWWKEDDAEKSVLIDAHRRNIADVSGAGDTVISVASLCLSAGLNPDDVARLANLAGGLVCEEAGVVPVNKQKLWEEAVRILTP